MGEVHRGLPGGRGKKGGKSDYPACRGGEEGAGRGAPLQLGGNRKRRRRPCTSPREKKKGEAQRLLPTPVTAEGRIGLSFGKIKGVSPWLSSYT